MPSTQKPDKAEPLDKESFKSPTYDLGQTSASKRLLDDVALPVPERLSSACDSYSKTVDGKVNKAKQGSLAEKGEPLKDTSYHFTETKPAGLPNLRLVHRDHDVSFHERPPSESPGTSINPPFKKTFESTAIPNFPVPETTSVERPGLRNMARKALDGGKELVKGALDHLSDTKQGKTPDLTKIPKDYDVKFEERPTKTPDVVKPAKRLEEIASTIPKDEHKAPHDFPKVSKAPVVDFEPKPSPNNYNAPLHTPRFSKEGDAGTRQPAPSSSLNHNTLSVGDRLPIGSEKIPAANTSSFHPIATSDSSPTINRSPELTIPHSPADTKTVSQGTHSEYSPPPRAVESNSLPTKLPVASEATAGQQKVNMHLEPPTPPLKKKSKDDFTFEHHYPVGSVLNGMASSSAKDELPKRSIAPQRNFDKVAVDIEKSIVSLAKPQAIINKNTESREEAHLPKPRNKYSCGEEMPQRQPKSPHVDSLISNTLKIELFPLRQPATTNQSVFHLSFTASKATDLSKLTRLDSHFASTTNPHDKPNPGHPKESEQLKSAPDKSPSSKDQPSCRDTRSLSEGLLLFGQGGRIPSDSTRLVQQPTRTPLDSQISTNKAIPLPTDAKPTVPAPKIGSDPIVPGKKATANATGGQAIADGIIVIPTRTISPSSSISITDKRHLTGAEIAIAAIIAAAGAAKVRVDEAKVPNHDVPLIANEDEELQAESKTTESNQDTQLFPGLLPELHIVGEAISLLETSQEKEAKSDLQPDVPESCTSSTTKQPNVFHRPTCLIAATDTLQSIAEELYHDVNLAWLIADLNSSSSGQQWIDGKRIIELSSRQEIILPVWQDIVYFYQNRSSNACPDNLVTIVRETIIDRELMDLTLGIVMGNAKEAPASSPQTPIGFPAT